MPWTFSGLPQPFQFALVFQNSSQLGICMSGRGLSNLHDSRYSYVVGIMARVMLVLALVSLT